MKAKVIFMMAAIMTASVVLANEDEKFAVMERADGIFKVIYEGGQSGDVQITIVNQNGELVFTKNYRKVNGFILPVNFTGMKAGEYTINLLAASGRFSKTIQYGLSAAARKAVPVVHVTKLNTENMYLLSIQGKSPELLDIRIMDSAMNVLHQESRIIEQAGIVFNLNRISGSPVFTVTTQSGEQVMVQK